MWFYFTPWHYRRVISGRMGLRFISLPSAPVGKRAHVRAQTPTFLEGLPTRLAARGAFTTTAASSLAVKYRGNSN